MDFDPKSSLVGNMAATIGILSGIEKQGLFFRFITYTISKKEKFKNLIAQQCNSL
jgi:hypothetical protein